MEDKLLPPAAYLQPNPDHYLNRDRETIAELKERIENL
jgi:hypothetical protein